MSKKPSRETSLAGLIGAMIVTVGAVIAFVVFREATREVPEMKPEAIEWAPAAENAVKDGHPIVVPEVPQDWIVTNIRFTPTLKPMWNMAMYTDAGNFAGVHQEDAYLNELVEFYVDEKAEEGEPVTITEGGMPGEWRTFTDDGGDFAFVRESALGVVLVYGSAPEDDLRGLVESIAPITGDADGNGVPDDLEN